MKWKKEDIWNDRDILDMILVTTNSTYKANGALVMGAGSAKELKDRRPGIDLKAGQWLRRHKVPQYGFYGLLLGHDVGMLQTKTNWRLPSSCELIRKSLAKLHEYAQQHPEQQIGICCPGVGHGKLAIEDVRPLLEQLPNNVTVYHRKAAL